MKFTYRVKLVLGLFSLFTFDCCVSFGQSSATTISDDKVYNKINKQAEFPGGLDSLINYISSRLNYPEDAKKQGIQGQVVASFIVDKGGEIRNIYVTRSLSPSCDKEVIKIIEAMPKWIPAEANGEKISTQLFLPVTFSFSE